MKCKNCPYKYSIKRQHGETYHCGIELTSMDVTYFVFQEMRTSLCPLENKEMRSSHIDYNKLIQTME